MDGVMGGKRMEKYWKSTEMRERSVCTQTVQVNMYFESLDKINKSFSRSMQ